MSKRFEWHSYYKRMVLDTKTNKIIKVIDTLNQQQERIAELEEQLSRVILPKFDRQEHIYCFAFGKIREFIVVAYLDNNTTLCEDTTTSHLEWCDNNFLVRTFEEATEKLRELQGEKK